MNKKCETCIKKDVCNIMKTDPKVKGCGYYLSDLSRYTETQKDIIGALQMESVDEEIREAFNDKKLTLNLVSDGIKWPKEKTDVVLYFGFKHGYKSATQKAQAEIETLRHKITLHKSRENYLLDKIEYMKNCYNCRLLATCLKKSKSICGEWKPKELR